MDQSCGNCRFFLLQDKNMGAGVCRRYPPQVLAGAWLTKRPFTLGDEPAQGTLVNEVQNIAGQNPPTSRDLWCGEHQEVPPKPEDTN
jgi:hypothetical protein